VPRKSMGVHCGASDRQKVRHTLLLHHGLYPSYTVHNPLTSMQCFNILGEVSGLVPVVCSLQVTDVYRLLVDDSAAIRHAAGDLVADLLEEQGSRQLAQACLMGRQVAV